MKFICTKESEIEITANTISGNPTCLSVPTGYQKVICSLEHAVFHLLGHSKKETHWAVSRLQSCHNFTTQSYHACSEECKQLVCNNNCWLHSKTNWVASYSLGFVQGNKHTQLSHFWKDALLYAESVLLDLHAAHAQSSSTWLHINDESFNSIPFVCGRELVWE